MSKEEYNDDTLRALLVCIFNVKPKKIKLKDLPKLTKEEEKKLREALPRIEKMIKEMLG